MNFIILFIKGIVLGIANVIPGVSGGTIAVVLRIFDNLIDAINNFFKDAKKHILFLLPLLLGAGVGILVFSVGINFALETYSLQTCAFFAGLVAGSIPLIYKMANAKNENKETNNTKYFVFTAISFAIVIGLSLLNPAKETTATTALDLGLIVKTFIGGVVASAAMIVPGISGSFMLVLMGLYPVIISNVAMIKDFLMTGDFSILIDVCIFLAPLGIGIIVGAILVAKAIQYLMNKFYKPTYYTILGLIFGSLFAIFLDPIAFASYPNGASIMVYVICVVTFAIGALVSTLMSKE